MPLAVIAFGSNIEPERHVFAAVEALSRHLRVLATSPVYETPPVGAPGTPPFLNGAVLVETDLSPREVRQRVLRPIEEALGRTRGEDPNAPRTIDLDLVLYEDVVEENAEMCLPAPDILRHAHVAVPLADLVPDWVHPTTGETMARIGTRYNREKATFRPRPDVGVRLRVLCDGARERKREGV